MPRETRSVASGGWTAGPWVARGRSVEAVNDQICEVVRSNNRERDLADARLIAAAPDMAEALAAVIRTKDEYDTYAKGGVMAAGVMDLKDMRARGNAAFDNARATLSKALGNPSPLMGEVDNG